MNAMFKTQQEISTASVLLHGTIDNAEAVTAYGMSTFKTRKQASGIQESINTQKQLGSKTARTPSRWCV
jgi:hypothetical protein